MSKTYVYSKLNEIETDRYRREYHIYGVILDVFHKLSYDRQGRDQDEYRLVVNDGTTPEGIKVTAFSKVGLILPGTLERGKIVRFHRLQKAPLKVDNGFYLFGRVGPISSILVFDLPPVNAPVEFNPSFRSAKNFSANSDTDLETVKELVDYSRNLLRQEEEEAEEPPQQQVSPRRSTRATTRAAESARTRSLAEQSPSVSAPQPNRIPTAVNGRNIAGEEAQEQQQVSPRRSPRRTPRAAASMRTRSLVAQSPSVSTPQPNLPAANRRNIPGAEPEEPLPPQQQVSPRTSTRRTPAAEPVGAGSLPEQSPSVSTPLSNHLTVNGRNIVGAEAEERSFTRQSATSRGSEEFTEIKNFIVGNSKYFNTLCQVISCYTNSYGMTFLRVWDGTRNPRNMMLSDPTSMNLVYGDMEKQELIAAQSKLYEITCYDEHAVAAVNFNAGDYVAVVNVHCYVPRDCQNPAMVMHGGSGTIRIGAVIKDAQRKILKITRENAENVFNHIDAQIKSYERSLLPSNEAEPGVVEIEDDDDEEAPVTKRRKA